MDEFTIQCTEAQIKKVLKLGASIEIHDTFDSYDIKESNIFYKDKFIELADGRLIKRITAEQMRGWLEKEKGISVEVSRQYGINKYCYYVFDNCGNDIESLESKIKFNSRKDAALAGIDTALKYITSSIK